MTITEENTDVILDVLAGKVVRRRRASVEDSLQHLPRLPWTPAEERVIVELTLLTANGEQRTALVPASIACVGVGSNAVVVVPRSNPLSRDPSVILGYGVRNIDTQEQAVADYPIWRHVSTLPLINAWPLAIALSTIAVVSYYTGIINLAPLTITVGTLGLAFMLARRENAKVSLHETIEGVMSRSDLALAIPPTGGPTPAAHSVDRS